MLRQNLNLERRLYDFQVLPGACEVYVRSWTSDSDDSFYPNHPFPLNAIAAGPAIRVNGPRGEKTLPLRGVSEYGNQLGGVDPDNVAAPPLPRYLDPGTYSIENQSPPQDTGTFSASINLAGEVRWTNQASMTSIDRTRPLRFEWSGGLDSREYVFVAGSSADVALKARVTFVCAERPSAGAIEVPAHIVGMLPRNTPNPLGLDFPNGLLVLGTNALNTAASVTEVGNLDQVFLRYSFLYGSVADFR